VIEAFLVGALAASTLILGAVLSLLLPIGRRALGLVLGFGAGVLLSAVAYELALAAFETAAWKGAPAIGFVAGVATFSVGSLLIDRCGGGGRMDIGGAGAEGVALAIVLGIVLDGVPESAVLGLDVLQGDLGLAILVAVLVSNVPEGVAATTGLRRAGHSTPRILGLWTAVTLVSGLAALVGYVLLDGAPPGALAFVLAFAGGAILTMLADTMMPEAFEEGGRWAGVVTALGFAVAFALSVAG